MRRACLGCGQLIATGSRCGPCHKPLEARRAAAGRARRGKDWPAISRRLLASWRANGVGCVDCGTTEDLTVDHVIPTVYGAASRYGGYVPRCRSCNSRRGTKLPTYAQDRLLG